jgi:hypothetical protein
VRVAELAAQGTCVVGDPSWAKDGTLRWFGSTVKGLDAIATAGIARVTDVGACSTPSESHVEPMSTTTPPAFADAPCPSDMVFVAGELCVDRFESMLVDARTGDTLSPDYSPAPSFVDVALRDWTTGRVHWGDVHARALPLPLLPAAQRDAPPEPVAVSRFGVRPNGYVTGVVAEAACVAAGKRLCTADEFWTACRGEDDTQFPYGDTYVEGVCNVARDDHPAAILHDNASLGHLDPRLNRVRAAGRPLLQTTGASPMCRSRWGADAAYDLVGNLDEWIDEGHGAFAGGFYSRGTHAGCDAMITAHPKAYLDYSTGVRCCRDARAARR